MRSLLPYMLLISAAAAQTSTPTPAQSIGEVQGADASVRGAVTLGANSTTIMSGSQVTAGASPAVINLTRGGEVKVCSGGSITITASASGRETLFALNHGAIETRYRLSSSADTIVTPDFRLLLPGPGDFNFAIGMKASGDMCVKSLPGNSSAMIVNEVFGEGTHQVRPGEAVMFQKGSVQNSIALAPGETCGCAGVAAKELGFPEQQSQQAAAAIAAGQIPLASAPLAGVSADKNEVITKVDAPIVFRGEDLKPQPGEAPSATEPNRPAAGTSSRPAEPGVKTAENPAPTPKPVKKKWFQRLGSAIANIFR
ncbi:MAG TPA: hypothetical protein VMZ25_04355 [Terriglobales bacterium]|nr:hypothetical protein [Terriglobales bacterium]